MVTAAPVAPGTQIVPAPWPSAGESRARAIAGTRPDLEYAARLHAAGVPCQVDVVAGMYHGADAFFRTSPAMNTFRATRKDALSAALTPI